MTHGKRPIGGFTLIELMVAVVVLGVIVAIAYPAYIDFIERSRRAEAQDALQNVATLQEQFYTHNKGYSSSLPALGMSATTENNYYQLSISAGDTIDGFAQSYTISASAQGTQTGDTDCATMTLNSNGDKSPAACW